jgi:hypothetical protein
MEFHQKDHRLNIGLIYKWFCQEPLTENEE